MTTAAPATMSTPFEFLRPEARTRWGISFAAVLAVHIAGAVAFASFHISSVLAPAEPAALIIDMTAIPEVQPVIPPPVVKPEILPEIEKAEVVIHKKKPKPKPKPVEEPKPIPEAKISPDIKPAAAPLKAAPLVAPAAPPSYLGRLMGHLERHKRYPRHAIRLRQTGIVHLKFSIDRQGRVLSANIHKSSGYTALDREVLATIKRADPLPAPPPELPQNPIIITVPVSFSLR